MNTYTLPKTVYDMAWMDLKTGELEKGSKKNVRNFDGNTAHNGDDEERFVVDLSNPNFTYNPVNNQITINTASGEVTQSSEMKITWKDASLSYSSETLSRTIRLNWSNDKDAATLTFESNGGSAVPMLRLLAGATLSGKMPTDPTRSGYTFAGWYTDKALTNAFNATTMPAGNTTLYAKWTPNNVAYTVEHYQKSLDGQYELKETDKTLTGKVGELTAAVARSYAGFTAQPVNQQTITADGSTRVAIYYDRNAYDLKFVYGSGSHDVTLKVLYGSAIVKPSNPIREGYNFAGWSATIPDTMPANALTFTALWTERTDTPYIVKHYQQNLNGTYQLEQTDGKTGTTGRSTEAAARTYTGFTVQNFTQKPILPDGSTVVEIFYNRNIHTLSWNVNGGNGLTGNYTTGNVMYGTPIVKPDTPTRAGYTFTGWYRDTALTNVLEDNATMPNTALTLYAGWSESEAGYTVKHIRQALDGSYTLVETEEKPGITGQSTDARARTYEGFTAQDVTQQIIAADGTTVVEILYTRNSYTVTFNGNGSDGGSMADQVFLYEETGNLNTNTFTRTGFTFTGWNTAADGNGTPYSDGASVQNLTSIAGGTVTLYAQWTVSKYTVMFDSNKDSGSSEPTTADSIQVFHDEAYGTLPTVSRTGYAFNGWYTAPSGGEKVEGTNTVTGSHTLYAQWTANSYSVIFDANDGSGSTQSQSFTYDVAQVLTANAFIKTGFTFTGWNTATDGNGTPYADGASVQNLTSVAGGTVTLYAQWTVNKYTVMFDSNKGSGSSEPTTADSIQVFHDEAYGTLPTVSRTGYVFNGWYTAMSGGTKVEDTNTVTGSHTLYAQWTANNYSVVFDANDGSGSTQSQSFTYDVAQVLTANAFIKTGFAFTGWNTAADGNGTPYADGASVQNLTSVAGGIVTLYAQWSNNLCTITFDSNKGSGSSNPTTAADIQLSYGENYGILPEVSRTGYTFAGWYTAPSGGEKVESTNTVTGNITLYAQWTPNTYTVVFDANDGSGSTQSQGFTYDMAQGLTPNGFIQEGYTFMCWSTESDGNGTSYEDGTSVINLTDEANGSVTLYAQWVDKNTEYNIWVSGIQVTASNANNVMGDGTVSYNAFTNTLTLNGATIKNYNTRYASNKAGIFTDNDLNIRLIGANLVDLSENTLSDRASCIFTPSGGLNIFGESLSDSLTLISADVVNEYSMGIYIGTFSEGSLSISNCTLYAKAGNSTGDLNQLCAGINGEKGIRIENAVVTAIGGNSTHTANWGLGLNSGSITIINSTVIAYVDGDVGNAFYRAPKLDPGVQVIASPNKDGSEPVPYNESNIRNYKYVEIRP